MQSRFAAVIVLAAAASSQVACEQGRPTHYEFKGLDKAGTGGGAGTGAAGAGTAGTGAAGNKPDGGGVVPPADGGLASGCGLPPDDPIDSFGPEHMIMVGMEARTYNVRLPKDYDPSTPYRTIFLGPGCGGNYQNTFRFNLVDMGQAILVTMNFSNMFVDLEKKCYDDQRADSIEYPFFDALHKEIEARYCVDKTKEFFAGYSTGSWLANMLGCKFPDVLRAQGGVSGELPPLPTCTDHPIAAMFIHDMMDMGNAYSGSLRARDRVLLQNKCQGTATAPYAPGAGATLPAGSQCLRYTGCPATSPVVFCTTIGQMHSSQDNWSVAALWNFFKQL